MHATWPTDDNQLPTTNLSQIMCALNSKRLSTTQLSLPYAYEVLLSYIVLHNKPDPSFFCKYGEEKTSQK